MMLRASSFTGSLGGMARAPEIIRRASAPFNRAKAIGPSRDEFYAGGAGRIRIQKLARGAVQSTVHLLTKYARLITQAILKPVYDVLKLIVRTAKNLSQGKLTLKKLRQMGHPYGKGKRQSVGRLTRIQGVSQMEVVNKQSGKFAAAWKGEIQIGSGGIILKLINPNRVAQFLLGTVKMKKHHPFVVAFERHMNELKTAWRKVTALLQQLARMANA